MNDIRCSICMATYNGQKYIHRQIESIMCQLAHNDELVISDDGSTDDTIGIIKSFDDPRIKIFKNGLGSGPVKNFENAISLAQGDIVFLADQDDVWIDCKINEHLKAHEKFDLVVSNATVMDDNNNVLFESFFKARGSGAGLLKNIKRNSYIGCCMSFNRKILTAALPFPGDIHMHDWWIGLIAEVVGKVHFLDKQLMHYLRHDNNASSTLIKTLPIQQQFLNRYVLIKNLLKFYFKQQ